MKLIKWELLNTTEEHHAFIIGFMETLCPWRARYPMNDNAEFKIDKEYHYYISGRGIGFIGLLLISCGISALLKHILS